MRCTCCQRNIAAGTEAQKMVVEYLQPDGSTQFFGHMMSGGALANATGRIVRGFHSKCFWVQKKRESRGDAVTGRVVAGGPTGYEIDQLVLSRADLQALGITPDQARERSTEQLSARVGRLREVAERLGMTVGDPQVQEAFAAQEHGGPYRHHHLHRLDAYQLLAHMQYAHGVSGAELSVGSHAIQDQHLALHAQAAQQAIHADRVADSDTDVPTRDWRTQFTAELDRGNP